MFALYSCNENRIASTIEEQEKEEIERIPAVISKIIITWNQQHTLTLVVASLGNSLTRENGEQVEPIGHRLLKLLTTFSMPTANTHLIKELVCVCYIAEMATIIVTVDLEKLQDCD